MGKDETKTNLKIPIFLALDMDSATDALKMARDVANYVGGFKVGPRLVMRFGGDFIQELSKVGPVFVDNKYHDIPSTMEAAVRTTFEAGASWATIHLSCGQAALEQLVTLERELNQKRFFRLVGVTVLTSFDAKTLPKNWKSQSISDHVSDLTGEAAAAGLRAVVSSAHEVSALKEKYPELYLITPGIRFMNESQGDQKRVMSPKSALEAGSGALVVGRPICQAKNPLQAAQSYHAAIQGV